MAAYRLRDLRLASWEHGQEVRARCVEPLARLFGVSVPWLRGEA